MDEEARFARVEVTVTSADGQVRTFAADWPAKAVVTVETGFQAALRNGMPWPSVIGPPAPMRLLVEVEADDNRPVAVALSAASQEGPPHVWLVTADSGPWFATPRVFGSEAVAREAVDHETGCRNAWQANRLGDLQLIGDEGSLGPVWIRRTRVER